MGIHTTLFDVGFVDFFEKIDELIKNVDAGIAQQFILNIFAPGYFGRSALLLRIWDKYESKMPGCLLSYDKEFKLANILKTCIDEISFRLPPRIVVVQDDYRESQDIEWLKELLVDLAKKALKDKRVTLLLIDDFDLWPDKDREWFTQEVLVPVVNTKKVVVLYTSKREFVFTDEFNLRMRREGYELRGFTQDAVANLYPTYESLATDIVAVTGGLPLMTEGFIQELELSEVKSSSDYHSRQQKLLEQYYSKYLDEVVFKGFLPDEKELVKVLAIPRRFGYSVLRRYLKLLMPDQCGEEVAPEEPVLDFMEERGLLNWRHFQGGGYTLNPSLRTMLLYYIKFRESKLYSKAIRALSTIYADLLKEDHKVTHFVELVYYRIRVTEIETQDFNIDVGRAIIRKEFEKYILNGDLGTWRGDDIDSLHNLLDNDNELKDYVPEDVLSHLKRNVPNGVI